MIAIVYPQTLLYRNCILRIKLYEKPALGFLMWYEEPHLIFGF